MIAMTSAHVLFLMTSLIYGLSQLVLGLELKRNTAFLDQAWPFGKKYFSTVITLQIILGLCVLFLHHWLLYLGLLGIHIFYAKKWRGTYNGGSDMMSFTVIVGLLIASLPFLPHTQFFKHLGLLLIAVQSLLSYVIAGLVKIKSPNWRNGQALVAFISCTRYHQGSPFIDKYAKLLSWSVILFELSISFLVLSQGGIFLFIGLAVLFHVMNAWYFGLNRFFWAWASTWPALVYLSQVIVKTQGIG